MGALTLKLFSIESREWEFIEGEGIDPTDSFGVNLRLSMRENQIFLAEPINPDTPWLTDRGRLFFDGMFEKQLSKSDNWDHAFELIFESLYFLDHFNFQNKDIFSFIFAFENLNLETLNMFYLLEQSCSMVKLKKVENYKTNNDLESYCQLNDSTQKLKLQMSTLCLLLNTNPRHEGYILNLNLRQRFFKGDFRVLSLGSMLDLTFPSYSVGSNLKIFKSIGSGIHTSCQEFKSAEFPIIVANSELFKRNDSKNFLKILKHTGILTTAWNGLNVLQHNISTAGINSLNVFLPLTSKDITNFFGVYFINVALSSAANYKKLTELQLMKFKMSKNYLATSFFVDQNSLEVNKLAYNKIKLKAKIYNNYLYLPSNLFLEDNETYVNTQGLIKRTTKLINYKKEAKSSWQIIRKFYANSRKALALNNQKDSKSITFNSVNLFNFKNYTNFQFYATQVLTSFSFYLTQQNKALIKQLNSPFKKTKIKLLNTKVKPWFDDFFNDGGKDVFSNNSSFLANCSKIARTSSTNFF